MLGLQTSSVLMLICSEVTRPGEESELLDITELATGRRKPRPLYTMAGLVLQPHHTTVLLTLIPQAKNSLSLRAASRELVTSLSSEAEFGEDNQALLACALVLSPWDPQIAPTVY